MFFCKLFVDETSVGGFDTVLNFKATMFNIVRGHRIQNESLVVSEMYKQDQFVCALSFPVNKNHIKLKVSKSCCIRC